MKVKNIDYHAEEMNDIQILYQKSFPENEHMSLTWLFDDINKGECLGFYQNHRLSGFAILCNHNQITNILYLAVQRDLQNQGIGTYILEYINNIKKNLLVVDIENENSKADNFQQRIRRKQFYLKNGFLETGIEYCWQNENYIILSKNGIMTKEQFVNFWKTLK